MFLFHFHQIFFPLQMNEFAVRKRIRITEGNENFSLLLLLLCFQPVNEIDGILTRKSSVSV